MHGNGLCCVDGSPLGGEGLVMMRNRQSGARGSVSSAFAGFRFPPEVILLAVRWYLRYGLSYRDVEELLAERGVEVDHVTALPVGAAVHPAARSTRPGRAGTLPGTAGSSTRPTSRSPASGATCTGRSTSTARSSTCTCPARRDIAAARRFFATALTAHGEPAEVVTDQAPALAERDRRADPRRVAQHRASTRTTGSNATTAGSRPGCDRCAG